MRRFIPTACLLLLSIGGLGWVVSVNGEYAVLEAKTVTYKTQHEEREKMGHATWWTVDDREDPEAIPYQFTLDQNVGESLADFRVRIREAKEIFPEVPAPN